MFTQIRTSILAIISVIVVAMAGQISLQSDTVTVRDATMYNKGTKHYGPLAVYGNTGISGYGSGHLLYAEVVGTQGLSYAAVYGRNITTASYGYGGYFLGGLTGVIGNATLSGSGTRTGGSFTGSGGATNYGIYASGATNCGYMVGGALYVNAITYPSDQRLKKNISDYVGGLNTILKLKPSTYEYDPSVYPALKLSAGKQYGLISQDVKQVLPEIVSNTAVVDPENPNTASDTIQTINYNALIPILINAVQEQQKQIAALQQTVTTLQGK